MASPSSHRIASSQNQGASISNLPIDVMHAILDVAPRPTTLALGRLSRAWRSGVITHRAGYLHIPLYRCDLAASARRGPRRIPNLKTELAALARAAADDRRVVLELNLVRVNGGSGIFGWRDARDARRMKSIVAAVQDALVKTVAELHVWVPPLVDPAERALETVLHGTAPLLQSFTIDIDYMSSYHLSSNFVPANVPQDVFSGNAPLLRTVSFSCFKFSDFPVEAFRYVTSATFFCMPSESFFISAHFPVAHTLDVAVFPYNRTSQDIPILLSFQETTALRKLRLRFVNPGECTGSIASPLGDIPNLDISGFSNANVDLCWAAIKEPSILEIESLEEPQARCYATLTCPGRRLRVGMHNMPREWDHLSLTCACVVELRLHQFAVEDFARHLSKSTEFPVLTLLRLVLHTSNEWPVQSYSTVFHFPALRDIHIETGSYFSGSRPTIVPDNVECFLRFLDVTQEINVWLHGVEWGGVMPLPGVNIFVGPPEASISL